MSDGLRALLVSYAFPPVGGAGVQRMAKLAKYLPAEGVATAVLTATNPSVPILDPTLVEDLPRELDVVRARTLEPSYATKAKVSRDREAAREPRASRVPRAVFATVARLARRAMVPDPQVLWLPAAARALAGRLRARVDDVVLVSGPPFSQFLLAPIAQRARVGVVLDYRDEWTTVRTAYELNATPESRFVGERLEPLLLRAADAITTATPEFRDELLRRFPFLAPERVVAIPNGYDPDDLRAATRAPPADRFVVTYAGTIFRLTSARGLLGAIRLLHAREPALAARLDVRFLGRIVDAERDAFDGMEALGVRTLGYQSHDEVIAALSGSHLALCLLDQVDGAERIFPAKIFELMAIGRPILTLAPEGALARLVRAHGLGDVLPPRDEGAIAEALAARLRAFRDGAYEPRLRAVGVEAFDRRAIARRFAQVMQQARARARG